FYGDFKNRPDEGFQYFEQTSPMNFKVHAVPIGKLGRWLTMDVQDFDKDGDKDLILGNLSRDLLIVKDYTPEWNEHIPFILLENKTRR
ncbi:MAG: VCBS repeat-containing protein, partial [Chitinophagaceae bacterium]|nr:VCBS repeat-containing protein [Chitinophagaceae bacterium]